MNSLLFFFLLLGAAAAQTLTPTGHSRSHGVVNLDISKEMVQKFITRIERSVKAKDIAAISGLFESDSQFVGCRGKYNKAQITKMLANLPSVTSFSFTLLSVQDRGNVLYFIVKLNGFEPYEVHGEFSLSKRQQKLENGIITNCRKTHRLTVNNNNVALINNTS